MSYLSRFSEVDLLITQLQPSIPAITDDMIKANFAGMLSVKAVTAYELAIKDILIEFSRKKHMIFGTFVDSSFSRINGKIVYRDLRNDIVNKYGAKYSAKFVKEISISTSRILKTNHVDLITTYNNLIQCRHDFVHKGTIGLSWDEAIFDYSIGKEVIEALNRAMRR